MHANTNFIAAHYREPEAIGKHLAGVMHVEISNMQMAGIMSVNDAKTDFASILLTSYFKRIPKSSWPQILKTYEQASGTSLRADLAQLIPDATVREPLVALLPSPIAAATLTLDAFLEFCAVGLSYSNQTAEELNEDTQDERRHSNPAALLRHFGFQAGPLILGRWGFQMRVFNPVAGQARWPHPIAAFRGTEGVQFDPKGDKAAKAAKAKGATVSEVAQARREGVEGTQDTIIGDLAPRAIGYMQYRPNADLIEQNLKAAQKYGKAYSVGHSLGGGIAQIVTAHMPELIHQTVTFQAPAIDSAMVNRLKQYNVGQGKADPIESRHYRVKGDIVPSGGQEMLPGQINYFDRVSRPKGTRESFDNSIVENVVYGHITPSLNTYVKSQRPAVGDLKALAQWGLNDEATLDKQAPKDVKIIPSGEYTTAKDPRMKAEKVRSLLAKGINAQAIEASEDSYEVVFYQHIAYNTLLSHVEILAKKSLGYEQFVASATSLIEGTNRLPMGQKELEMAKVLKIDLIEVDRGAWPSREVKTVQSKLQEYLQQGVLIDPKARDTVLGQLRIIWGSWSGR